MASMPPRTPTPRELMSLGMFVFGMDSLPYQSLRRSMEWRHGEQERHQARPASQYLGPGAETISISGLLVVEIAGDNGSFETLRTMAETGDDYPLMDGYGRIFGHYLILRIEEEHLTVMAGGVPRHTGFNIELKRVEDERPQATQ